MNTKIPECVSTFQAGDQTFRLDLVEACQAVNRLAAEARAACAAEGRPENFDHVDRFRAWVKERAGVELTPAQADWLVDHVSAEYVREKKGRRGADSPPSPSSTDSTPSA